MSRDCQIALEESKHSLPTLRRHTMDGTESGTPVSVQHEE
jgi:hypothetical protein